LSSRIKINSQQQWLFISSKNSLLFWQVKNLSKPYYFMSAPSFPKEVEFTSS
jgi:hypothetical protein